MEQATGALDVAEEHDYQVWRALALALQGVAIAGLGRPEEGHAQIERGIALYEGLNTPPIFWPVLLSLRARGFALSGRPTEGLDAIDQVIELTGGGNILDPEFALLKAELLWDLADVDGADHVLQGAYDSSRRMGIRMSQLRAAVRLTRLRRAVGTRPDGTDALRRIYETFTEGLATPDLVDARNVLERAAN